MIKGKTKSGFEFTLSEDVLDDYEILELLCDIEAGEYNKITFLVNLLLGKEQRDALKEHLRQENGHVSATAMVTEVMEIFEASSQGKNS